MERQGEERNGGLEIQSSVLSENALEFMSREHRVGLEGWRWLEGWTEYDSSNVCMFYTKQSKTQ